MKLRGRADDEREAGRRTWLKHNGRSRYWRRATSSSSRGCWLLSSWRGTRASAPWSRPQQTGGMLVMAAQKSAATDEPEPDDIYSVGTLAKVVQFSRLSDGTLKALIEGRERVTIDSYEATAPLFTVRYTPIESKIAAQVAAHAGPHGLGGAGVRRPTWARPRSSPRRPRPPWRRSPTRRAWSTSSPPT